MEMQSKEERPMDINLSKSRMGDLSVKTIQNPSEEKKASRQQKYWDRIEDNTISLFKRGHITEGQMFLELRRMRHHAVDSCVNEMRRVLNGLEEAD
jgi:hypothetical protein